MYNLFQKFHMHDGGIVIVQYFIKLLIAYNFLDKYICDCNYVASNEADYLLNKVWYLIKQQISSR